MVIKCFKIHVRQTYKTRVFKFLSSYIGELLKYDRFSIIPIINGCFPYIRWIMDMIDWSEVRII